MAQSSILCAQYTVSKSLDLLVLDKIISHSLFEIEMWYPLAWMSYSLALAAISWLYIHKN